ncbi:MAG TPA: rhodanese [Planctomycetaceae bacterium]|nr:rhodanese [Planctomycetaceae bacterium]
MSTLPPESGAPDESAPLEIDVHETLDRLKSGQITLIDCREESEWETARIDGAQLMPMSNWAEQAEKLDDLKGQAIVVHCHHGGRSLQVTNWLRQNGFPDAQNMIGGIDVWSQEIDPDVPRY